MHLQGIPKRQHLVFAVANADNVLEPLWFAEATDIRTPGSGLDDAIDR